MLERPKPRTLPIPLFSCALLLCCSTIPAHENCNVEVKLLLSAGEAQAAVAALNGTNETHGRIYFFDTDTLDLLSEGVIIRLREGTRSDLTVKLRPPEGRGFVSSSVKNDDFKCEVHLTGNKSNLSYSMTSRFAAEQFPQTGSEVAPLLGPAQMQLLTDAQVSVDWTRVKGIAEIRSTVWRTQSQPHLGKLALELWEWPGGAILELSTKVSPGSGPSAFTELQRLVKKKRLMPNAQQRPKTAIALEAIEDAAQH